MAEYLGTASGADLDRVPELINEVENHEERITNLEAGGGGGGTGSVVVVNPIQTDGTKIAEISVNGQKKSLFAPTYETYDDTEVRSLIGAKADKSEIPNDSHINSLIDAKLTPLEALADSILGVI